MKQIEYLSSLVSSFNAANHVNLMLEESITDENVYCLISKDLAYTFKAIRAMSNFTPSVMTAVSANPFLSRRVFKQVYHPIVAILECNNNQVFVGIALKEEQEESVRHCVLTLQLAIEQIKEEIRNTERTIRKNEFLSKSLREAAGATDLLKFGILDTHLKESPRFETKQERKKLMRLLKAASLQSNISYIDCMIVTELEIAQSMIKEDNEHIESLKETIACCKECISCISTTLNALDELRRRGI